MHAGCTVENMAHPPEISIQANFYTSSKKFRHLVTTEVSPTKELRECFGGSEVVLDMLTLL